MLVSIPYFARAQTSPFFPPPPPAHTRAHVQVQAAALTPRVAVSPRYSGRYTHSSSAVSSRSSLSRGSMTASTSPSGSDLELTYQQSARSFRAPRPSDAKRPGGLFSTRGVTDADAIRGMTLFGDSAEDLTGLKSLRASRQGVGRGRGDGGPPRGENSGRPMTANVSSGYGNGGGGGTRTPTMRVWSGRPTPGSIGVGGVAKAQAVSASGSCGSSRPSSGSGRPSTSVGRVTSHRSRIASARAYNSTYASPPTHAGVVGAKLVPPARRKFVLQGSPHELLIKEARAIDSAMYVAEITNLAAEYNDSCTVSSKRQATLRRLEMEMLQVDQLAENMKELLVPEREAQRGLEEARGKVQDMKSQTELMHFTSYSMDHVLTRLSKDRFRQGEETREMRDAVKELAADLAELTRAYQIVRSEKREAVGRQQRIAQKYEVSRARHEAELHGLRRVHAAHLHLCSEREKWRAARDGNTYAREVQDVLKSDLLKSDLRVVATCKESRGKHNDLDNLTAVFSKLRVQTGITDLEQLVDSLCKRNDPVHIVEMQGAKDRGKMRIVALSEIVEDHKSELRNMSTAVVSSSSRVADQLHDSIAHATQRVEQCGEQCHQANVTVVKCKAWSESMIRKLVGTVPDLQADKVARDMERRAEPAEGIGDDVEEESAALRTALGGDCEGVHVPAVYDAGAACGPAQDTTLMVLNMLEFRLDRVHQMVQNQGIRGGTSQRRREIFGDTDQVGDDTDTASVAVVTLAVAAEEPPPLTTEKSRASPASGVARASFLTRSSTSSAVPPRGAFSNAGANNMRVADPSCTTAQEEVAPLDEGLAEDSEVKAGSGGGTDSADGGFDWGRDIGTAAATIRVHAQSGENWPPDVSFGKAGRSAHVVSRNMLKKNSQYVVQSAHRHTVNSGGTTSGGEGAPRPRSLGSNTVTCLTGITSRAEQATLR